MTSDSRTHDAVADRSVLLGLVRWVGTWPFRMDGHVFWRQSCIPQSAWFEIGYGAGMDGRQGHLRRFKGWPGMRRALLSTALLLMMWAWWRTQLRGELFQGEAVWLGAMCIPLVAVIIWNPSIRWSGSFLVVFLALLASSPGNYAGPAWFAAYAVCIDSNSRRPIWWGAAFTGAVIGVSLWKFDIGEGIASSTYLVILSILGQFVRVVIESARAREEAADLRRRLEVAALSEAVHDAGSARLAQVLLVARGMEQQSDFPKRLVPELRTLIEVASAGTDELRHVISGGIRNAPVETGDLVSEWDRSARTLRSAGFEVAASSAVDLPDLQGTASLELLRAMREATTNICVHGAQNGRVLQMLKVVEGNLVLTWTNDVVPGVEAIHGSGIGIAGLRARMEGLGGNVEAALGDNYFTLSVVLPMHPAPASSDRHIVAPVDAKCWIHSHGESC